MTSRSIWALAAKLEVMREKTARLRALRLARDAANKKTPPINITKGAA
jgi:hypothetical protein